MKKPEASCFRRFHWWSCGESHSGPIGNNTGRTTGVDYLKYLAKVASKQSNCDLVHIERFKVCASMSSAHSIRKYMTTLRHRRHSKVTAAKLGYCCSSWCERKVAPSSYKVLSNVCIYMRVPYNAEQATCRFQFVNPSSRKNQPRIWPFRNRYGHIIIS